MSVTVHVDENLKRLNVLKKDVIVIGVSGGMDSMLLWNILSELGYNTVAVHINYKLRAEDSEADEALVKSHAVKNNLELYCFSAESEDLSVNLQERAREFRYSKFIQVSKEKNAQFIATAHHLEDDIETFFLNLIRGAGVKGLKGIAEKTGKLIRPLLNISKADLIDFANSKNLNWREDSSNTSDKYLRNRIRHNVLPALKDADNRAESGLKNSLEILKRQNSLFKFFIDQYRTTHFRKTHIGIEINVTEELRDTPQLLYELLVEYGEFEVSQLLQSYENTGAQFFSSTHCITVNRGKFLITEIENNEYVEIKIEEEEQVSLANCQMNFEIRTSLPQKHNFKLNTAWLDYEQLSFPLTLRTWKNGDSFQPFGMKGRKKVSDYLIDLKMPLPEKNKVLVLESEGKIIWLVNHRIDDRFKVSAKTKKIYLATLLK